MKVLLYFESEKMLSKSGIGRALKHQLKALELVGVETTTDPFDSYDILHINTVGLNSQNIINHARKENKKVIYHAHSTEEDFRDSFVLSNTLAPLVKKRLVNLYSQADRIITPTPYSKSLLEGYGISIPINDISNGIDIDKFSPNFEKIKAFRKYFGLTEDQKIVLGVGLYFERKGILDFMEVARRCPEYTFIWFGYTPLYSIPKHVKDAVTDHPDNVILPGYVKGPVIEGAYGCSDVFFFPSHEETEGIVVLEALAAKRKVIIRDIPVYDPWLISSVNCYKGNNVEEFVELINKSINNELNDTTENGYQTAKERNLLAVGEKLKNIYTKVLCEDNDKES